VHELGPRGGNEQQRTADVVQPCFEEVEEGLLRPVQVFDQHDGALLGHELLEERDPRLAKPIARGERMEVCRCLEPEREAQDRAFAEPTAHRVGRIALEQAEVLANDLTERQVRDPAAVREAAPDAPLRFGRLRAEPLPELADQRRLPDSGLAHDRDELGRLLLDRATVCTLQRFELLLAADEGVAQPAHAARPHQRERADEPATDDSVGLSLRRERQRLVELERTAHRRSRALADEDLARLGGLLESRRDVDRVAGDEGAALARLSHHDVAGVHADPQRERIAEQLLEPALHRERRVQRALRVILLRRGRAEGRHDGIADELLDRSARVGDLRRHRVVEAVEQGARSLRILRAGELRRAHEIREEHGRKLPLFARLLRLGDRTRATRAEASSCRNKPAAIRAERHVAIVAFTPRRGKRALRGKWS
jgi:hypothetical protein